MKIERLDINKIKVTVSPQDLREWDIPVQTLSPESPHLRDFITSLIKQAETETGFDSFGANILIEATPMGNDYVFVITRVENANIKEAAKQVLREKLKNKQFRVIRKRSENPESEQSSGYNIFSLKSFERFVSLFKLTGKSSAFDGCELYKLADMYYIKVPQNKETLCAVCDEFAEGANELSAEALCEHGKLICSKANFAEVEKFF